jgi:hypothetical protein
MKTFMTISTAAAPSRTIRQLKAARYRLAVKRSLLTRVQHFIESTDWEGRYLCHKSIDKICLGGTIAAVIYFLPVLMSILWAM